VLFHSWLVQLAGVQPAGKDDDDDDGAVAMETDNAGVAESKTSGGKEGPSNGKRVGLPVSPLPLFQPNDLKQLVSVTQEARPYDAKAENRSSWPGAPA
jgi:hypothetical protein